MYVCLDLIFNGPKSSVSLVSLQSPSSLFQEEILEEPPDLSQYPLMVDLVKHAGPNWSFVLLGGWSGSGEGLHLKRGKLETMVSCEIWEMQIDVLGGSFAFSQRCNQKECVGNESLVHSTWKWDVGDNVGPNAACICSYFSQCRLFHQLGPILSCPFFRSQKSCYPWG